tara:strand:+ start:29044 stop:29214 length:171 start_codon:yes stop_codon:yes gene_type:complete
MKHNPKKVDTQIMLLWLTANLKNVSMTALVLAIGYSAYATAKAINLNPLAYFVHIV